MGLLPVRASAQRRWRAEHGDPPDTPDWATTGIGVMHCGAGCTLGDIIAESAIFMLGVAIAGRAIWAEYVGDYALALLLGIAFQYFAIAPMRGLSLGKGLWQAAKADVLSLTAFEVGLFGWMALMALCSSRRLVCTPTARRTGSSCRSV
ncbi:DUF4396 domain-containing protein [Luedemannella flava]